MPSDNRILDTISEPVQHLYFSAVLVGHETEIMLYELPAILTNSLVKSGEQLHVWRTNKKKKNTILSLAAVCRHTVINATLPVSNSTRGLLPAPASGSNSRNNAAWLNKYAANDGTSGTTGE